MFYRNFKGLKLSALGMGNMRLPTVGKGSKAPIDTQKAQEIIDYAMASGINYYDTAYIYHGGESEKFLGNALKKYPRESFYLADKFYIEADPDYRAVFDEQLKRLQTDYIDFYLIHCLFDHTVDRYIESGCIEYFLQQQKAGRIKYLGFSSHASPESLERFAAHHNWDFAQIQLNYLDWIHSTAKREYEILAAKNIPIMVMEPLRGGRLASLNDEADALLKKAQPDNTVASWGFRWLMRLPNILVVLSGMSDMSQIEDNVKTFAKNQPLSDEVETLLFKARDLFYNKNIVPCTSCGYCMDGCAQKINVPKLMSIYNEYKLGNVWNLKKISDETKKPSDCVACGGCMKHCPQGINIISVLEELATACDRAKK